MSICYTLSKCHLHISHLAVCSSMNVQNFHRRFMLMNLFYMHESLLQSLFLLSTALVLLGHTCHWSIVTTEKDLLSILRWSHLAHHWAQFFAADQLQFSSINLASSKSQSPGNTSRSCTTFWTLQSVSKQAIMLIELSSTLILEQIYKNNPFSFYLCCDNDKFSATPCRERSQWSLHPLRSLSAISFPTADLSHQTSQWICYMFLMQV